MASASAGGGRIRQTAGAAVAAPRGGTAAAAGIDRGAGALAGTGIAVAARTGIGGDDRVTLELRAWPDPRHLIWDLQANVVIIESALAIPRAYRSPMALAGTLTQGHGSLVDRRQLQCPSAAALLRPTACRRAMLLMQPCTAGEPVLTASQARQRKACFQHRQKVCCHCIPAADSSRAAGPSACTAAASLAYVQRVVCDPPPPPLPPPDPARCCRSLLPAVAARPRMLVKMVTTISHACTRRRQHRDSQRAAAAGGGASRQQRSEGAF